MKKVFTSILFITFTLPLSAGVFTHVIKPSFKAGKFAAKEAMKGVGHAGKMVGKGVVKVVK